MTTEQYVHVSNLVIELGMSEEEAIELVNSPLFNPEDYLPSYPSDNPDFY